MFSVPRVEDVARVCVVASVDFRSMSHKHCHAAKQENCQLFHAVSRYLFSFLVANIQTNPKYPFPYGHFLEKGKFFFREGISPYEERIIFYSLSILFLLDENGLANEENDGFSKNSLKLSAFRLQIPES